MGRADNEAPFRLPDAAVVKKYEATLVKEIGPSFDHKDVKARHLLVDVTSSHVSAWNLRCSRLFAKAYVALGNAKTTDIKKVMSLFQGQIKGMKKAHSKLTRDMLPPEGRAKLAKDATRQREYSRVREVSFKSNVLPLYLPLLTSTQVGLT